MEKSNLLAILRANQTVFSFKDILLAHKNENSNLLKRRINYYVKKGELYSIRRGFYAKDKNYDRFELAARMYTPSYISFETVLARAGIVFQFYGQIFVASYLTREIVVDGQQYSYRKIKDLILTNNAGIESKNNCVFATPERAFLDVVYLHKDYYFDNLTPLNWDQVFEILPIYGSNQRMKRKVKKYYEYFQSEK
jgi:hypothetical protein